MSTRRLSVALCLLLGACGERATGAPARSDVDRLFDADPAVQAQAASDLVARGAASVPGLCLPDTVPVHERSTAIGLLREIGPEARAAVPWLIDVHAREPLLRASVKWALGRIGPAAAPAVTDALRASESPDARASLVEALGLMRTSEERTARVLVDVLERDPSDVVRARAAGALGRTGVRTPDVLSALEGAVRAGGSLVPFYAGSSLGELGESGVDVLLRLRRESSEDVRAVAASAIGRARGAPARRLAALLELLDDPAPWVHRAAAIGLDSMGADAKSAVGALREHGARWEQAGDTRAAESAAEAVAHIERPPEEVLDEPPEPRGKPAR